MNCSVGHEGPDTSDVTVIGVVVPSRGHSCSGETVNEPGVAAACTLDGAVDTIDRSDQHATSDNAPAAIATIVNAVRVLPTVPLLAGCAGSPCWVRWLAAGPRADFMTRATALQFA